MYKSFTYGHTNAVHMLFLQEIYFCGYAKVTVPLFLEFYCSALKILNQKIIPIFIQIDVH